MALRIVSKTVTPVTTYVGRFSDGSDRVAVPGVSCEVELDAHGQRLRFTLDHDPTADELDAMFPAPTDVIPPNAVRRRDVARARADAWNTSRLAAAAAQTDAAFTAQERTRLQALADADRDALRQAV
jgi:hypothetical protein